MTESTKKIKTSTNTIPPRKPFTILSEKASKIFIWAGIAVIIIGLFLFLWHGNINPSADIKPDFIAQLGDFVGGVAGSLWALAGVILFYVALEKQKEALDIQVKEFALQREELKLQRNELAETKAVFKEQSKTQQIAQFETVFYNLIELFKASINEFKDEYIEDIGYGAEKVSLEGGSAIRKIYEDIEGQANRIPYSDLQDEKILSIYTRFYRIYELYLKTYFSLLTEILHQINEMRIEERKETYVRIVDCFLSDAGKGLISNYITTSLVDQRLKEYYEQYFSS